jgi:predicted ATPase
MLTSLRLRNFKSFADAQAPFAPLTLLVGANASGKSNVLDALRLLKGLGAENLLLEEVLAGTAGWTGIRGGIHEAVRAGAEAFVLETSWRLEPEKPGYPVLLLEHLIECAVTPSPLIRHEKLLEVGKHKPLFEISKKEASRRSYLYVQADFGRMLRESGGVIGVRPLFQELEEIRLLDVVPSAMRGYVPQKMRELGENGENLSAILWQLCQAPEQKKDLVDWLSELCSPELADIEFSTTDEGDVMLRLVEADGSKVSARSLSDGTLRFLGELVALRTAPKGSIILLEELGRELHPSRVHLLIEYLESITEERGIQVIATTHSPLVLEALGPETRGNVVALGRVPGHPGTVMKRVGDLPRFQEVVERRGMAYLFTTNWLEQAL